ncbi:hypothetical protein KUCAC02_015330, partial [Chaenocephalus aceratus]
VNTVLLTYLTTTHIPYLPQCPPEEPPAVAAVVVMVLKQLCLGRTAERIVM